MPKYKNGDIVVVTGRSPKDWSWINYMDCHIGRTHEVIRVGKNGNIGFYVLKDIETGSTWWFHEDDFVLVDDSEDISNQNYELSSLI